MAILIDHIHLANHQNELHAKALPVLRFGWSGLNCGSEQLHASGDYNEQPVWIAEYCIVQFAFCNLHNGIMLYDTICHANLESVIRYPYPIRIRGIVENDVSIYLYPQKFTDIRKYLSAHLCPGAPQRSD